MATDVFQKDPCKVFTSAQLQEIGLDPGGRKEDSPFGPRCAWRNVSSGARVSITFGTGGDDIGLSGAYAAHDDGELKMWEVLPDIEGFPAVVADILDRRGDGGCTVVVGVTDELAFSLDINLSVQKRGKVDPCQVGGQVSGLALKTMKA